MLQSARYAHHSAEGSSAKVDTTCQLTHPRRHTHRPPTTGLHHAGRSSFMSSHQKRMPHCFQTRPLTALTTCTRHTARFFVAERTALIKIDSCVGISPDADERVQIPGFTGSGPWIRP